MRRGIDPDVIVRLPHGSHAAIAMSWTDYGEGLPQEHSDQALPLLDLQGLRQVAHLIEQLRQDGRLPPSRQRLPRVGPSHRTLLPGHQCSS
jgi:hypothetical protein